KMAIPILPSEHINLLKTPTEISHEHTWRPRCEFSFEAVLGQRVGKILVRDSWMASHMRRPHLRKPRMDTKLPVLPSISFLTRGSKPILYHLIVKDVLHSKDGDATSPVNEDFSSWTTFRERDQPLEEPWLLQSSFLSHEVTESFNNSASLTGEEETMKYLQSVSLGSESHLNDLSFSRAPGIKSNYSTDSNSKMTSSLIYEPVEEPWLLQPSVLVSNSNDKIDFSMSVYEALHNETTHAPFDAPEDQVKEKFLPGDGSNSITEDTVSTVILINSSICTVQRIAVLEDGKLVELLLEPVKNNVQCDSVYIGIITKLVPHMGGAFVNIGSSRASFMDIKHNREPFIFPPFRSKTKGVEQSGSLPGTLRLHQAATAPETEQIADNVEVLDNISLVDLHDDPFQDMAEDFDVHELEDDFDGPDILKENMNGSAADYGTTGVYYNNLLDQCNVNEHHSEGEPSDDVLPVENGGAYASQMSHYQEIEEHRGVQTNENVWDRVQKGTKIIVQVVKEGLGTKGPTLTAYPNLRSRFWILITRCAKIGVSKKITGVERTRLRVIAKTLQPQGFGLTVRTVAAGHSLEELQKDLEGLLSTWKDVIEDAKSAALAADEGVEGAIPVILHRAMGQTLSVVKSMVVDSQRTYHEVTNYLQEIAPDLCDRVELYNKRNPLFDEFNIEEEINNILSKRVPLANGGSLVIEQTEALVSIDVNGGHGMFGHGTSQERAILDVNLAAAKQIAREIRLRDIGGIIVVDFIDMVDDANKRLVYEEVKKAVERDRSTVKVSELSRHGLMEITRKRVRPSVTFMVSEPCSCCHATGRVEALETSFSKIEREICRLLATMDRKADAENPNSWPRFILRVDRYMCTYLTSGKRTRLAILSSSLKVWILLKVARGFNRGAFEVKLVTDGNMNDSQNYVAISVLRPTETGTYIPSRKLSLFPLKKWKTGFEGCFAP
ncbi:RNA-binding protein AU-1/Ribonuclease E/G, partial [Dillenia turbinata]